MLYAVSRQQQQCTAVDDFASTLGFHLLSVRCKSDPGANPQAARCEGDRHTRSRSERGQTEVHTAACFTFVPASLTPDRALISLQAPFSVCHPPTAAACVASSLGGSGSRSATTYLCSGPPSSRALSCWVLAAPLGCWLFTRERVTGLTSRIFPGAPEALSHGSCISAYRRQASTAVCLCFAVDTQRGVIFPRDRVNPQSPVPAPSADALPVCRFCKPVRVCVCVCNGALSYPDVSHTTPGTSSCKAPRASVSVTRALWGAS